MIIVYLVSILVITLLSIISMKKCSKPLIVFVEILFLICLFSFIIYSKTTVITYILTSVALIISVIIQFFIGRSIEMDLKNEVYTIKGFINRCKKPKDTLIIGNVMPYDRRRLKYNNAFISMDNLATAGGTLISGSSGSGKTFGITQLISQAMANGHSVLCGEFKGDKDFIRDIKREAKKYGFNFFLLSDGEANFNYDPLKHLNNIGRVESIINMRKWALNGADAHYRTSVQLLLQNLIGQFSTEYDEKYKNWHGSAPKPSFTVEFYKMLQTYTPGKQAIWSN